MAIKITAQGLAQGWCFKDICHSCQTRSWETSYVKGQILNILGSVDQMQVLNSPIIAQKAVTDKKSMNGHGHVSIKLYL